jgi:hypothetical protein
MMFASSEDSMNPFRCAESSRGKSGRIMNLSGNSKKPFFEISAITNEYIQIFTLHQNLFMHGKDSSEGLTGRVLFSLQTLITRPCPYYKAPFMEQ